MQIFPLKIPEHSLRKVLSNRKYCPKHLTMYWTWASLIQGAPEALPWAEQGLRGLEARQQVPERCEQGSTCSEWEKKRHECCSEICHEQIDGDFQNRGNNCERNLPFLALSSPGRVCDPSSHFAFWSALFILSPIVMGQFSFHAITCCSTNYIFALRAGATSRVIGLFFTLNEKWWLLFAAAADWICARVIQQIKYYISPI